MGKQSATPTGAVLVVSPELPDQWEVPISDPGLSIGSSEECDVIVDSQSVAAVHVTIAQENGDFVLRSLDAAEGTYIDGRRVRRAVLQDGTAFRCGDQTFTFRRPVDRVSEPALLMEVEPGDSQVSASNLARQWKTETRRRRHPASGEDLERRLLLKTAEWLSLPQPVESILERVLDLAIDTFGADRGVVLLRSDETGELEPRTVRGSDGQANPVSAFSRRIVRHVYDKGVAALFENPIEDARIEGSDSVRRHAITSSMCAPLSANDQVVGVLYLDCRSAQEPLGHRELEVLSAMANQAAVALENSKLRGQLEREAVQRSHLARFFPPTIVQEMLDRPQTLDQPCEREITALFCDVSGFTSMVVQMPPLSVVKLLNQYLPAIVEVVFALDGTLEKYVGDALLAVWGAPLSKGDDAARAVRAACGMQHAVADLIDKGSLPPDFAVHIGLATGVAAAGNIGTESYMQYATIGAATTLAARLCDVAPRGSIAICPETYQRVAHEPFECTSRGPVALKGIAEPQACYEVAWRTQKLRRASTGETR